MRPGEVKAVSNLLKAETTPGRKIKDPWMEQSILDEIQKENEGGSVLITRMDIMKMGKSLQTGDTKLKLSKGWLDKFIIRNEIKVRKINH